MERKDRNCVLLHVADPVLRLAFHPSGGIGAFGFVAAGRPDGRQVIAVKSIEHGTWRLLPATTGSDGPGETWIYGSSETMTMREDVGRHNALDQLAGALAVEGVSGSAGAVILTSRISVEMVQKTAAIGAVGISAPTALAVRTAQASGITLMGIARGSEFEIFSHQRGFAA